MITAGVEVYRKVYTCDVPDCVGGEAVSWDPAYVPTCWGWAGEDTIHPMTPVQTPSSRQE